MNEETKKTPTWGQQVADLILRAKKEAIRQGRILMISEVAEIIDMADQARAPNAPETLIPCDSSHFGDKKVIPPTPEWVTAYSASIGYPMNGQTWCDSYAAKGWVVGKHKMKDWQAAVRNWKTNDYAGPGVKIAPAKTANDYTKF